ncbi:helix-turn-helix protein [Marinilabilia salmonicolor]|jgi:transcriptional regulator with XRE-family HTH domain|uniref:helix-turn-helix domain-containing protein n=1 Tax=Marinilabilia salmonicolor TaxID=989 RepID=UPI000D0826E1|nr:helix-turn-helix transcriptional regulator [Marinilabilia salmonicolor]PRY98882.1 helix-turn-helix protein [Marinilabilia salmonicolor]
MDNNDQFTVLENKKIGRNLALYRKMRDKKALEVAEHLGLSEAAYTKYERGESKITVELVQKVSEFLKVDPLAILSAQPGHFIESIENSPISGTGSNGIGNSSSIGGDFSSYDKKQAEMMMKLMENVVRLSERVIEMMEKG